MNWPIVLSLIAVATPVTFLMQREIQRLALLRQYGLRAKGTVTGHKVRIRRSSTIHPLITFTTLQGQVFEVEGRIGLSVPLSRKGDNVVVLYDEGNPNSFLLEDETDDTYPYNGMVVAWLIVFAFLVVMWQSS